MAKRRSRLSRHTERKTKQNLVLSLFGIAVVIFIVFKLGIPLLVNFSLFIANQKDKTDTTQQVNNPSFIPPPVLNPLPVATNSAKVSVSGIGSPNQTVRVYVNGDLADEVSTKKDGSFSSIQDIKKGPNSIKAKSEQKGKTSGFSNTVTVNYIDTKPTMELTSPSDGQSFSKENNKAPVTGKVSAGARITVNGFWAIVDENSNFSYNLSLQSGENQIKVIATDEAGNTTEREIKVTYNP